MIAHADEPASIEPRRAHLIIRGRQLLQHGIVHPLPIGAVLYRKTLISPPDNVAGVDHESRAPRSNIFYDLAADPIAAAQPEYRSMHAGKQFHVFDFRL